MDLVDLKIPKDCKVNINGQQVNVVCLYTIQNDHFAMIAGGKLVAVTVEQYEVLRVRLDEFFKKHLIPKK